MQNALGTEVMPASIALEVEMSHLDVHAQESRHFSSSGSSFGSDPASKCSATQVQLARFVSDARVEDVSEEACEQLKLRVLDAPGCALGALDTEPTRIVLEHVRELGGASLATLIGAGCSAPDRGFHTRLLSWEAVAAKFERLAESHLDAGRRGQIRRAVGNLERLTAQQLGQLLGDSITEAAP